MPHKWGKDEFTELTLALLAHLCHSHHSKPPHSLCISSAGEEFQPQANALSVTVILGFTGPAGFECCGWGLKHVFRVDRQEAGSQLLDSPATGWPSVSWQAELSARLPGQQSALNLVLVAPPGSHGVTKLGACLLLGHPGVSCLGKCQME